MSTVSAPAEVVLCDVRDAELSVDEVLRAVHDPECGGIVLFIGQIRRHDHGGEVRDLDYSAHPQALAALEEVCSGVAERGGPLRLAAVHRTGHLAVGEIAVIVAAAAPHRGEAFAACHDLIDILKERVPIWKHQHFADGSDEWVGLP